MIKNISYELPISPNYVINWGVKEAIRELLQNAIDEDKVGHSKEIEYDQNSQILKIKNIDSCLHSSSLVLGCSHKQDVEGLVGKFGEGYKLALVVLLREGFTDIMGKLSSSLSIAIKQVLFSLSTDFILPGPHSVFTIMSFLILSLKSIISLIFSLALSLFSWISLADGIMLALLFEYWTNGDSR